MGVKSRGTKGLFQSPWVWHVPRFSHKQQWVESQVDNSTCRLQTHLGDVKDAEDARGVELAQHAHRAQLQVL